MVVALGGNAIARRGRASDVEEQRKILSEAVSAVATLARDHDVVVTHGNGPQVGWLALESEAAGHVTPLDVLGAESEGMIGYWIEQELGNRLPGRDVATLLTQVEVRPDDPAFRRPTKPIGPPYDEAKARRLAAERGWSVAPDGDGFRRVVPSPTPRQVLEIGTIQLLMRFGVVVVCAGGGGIPVVRGPEGRVHGVEAVIDKDHSAALLATLLSADHLLLLTDVPAVYLDWPDREQPIRTASPRAMQELSLDPGSMGPKVEAACHFVRQTGGMAHIGALEDAPLMLTGKAGTHVSPGVEPLRVAGTG
jgi:carbamate kinase